jgi:hypothetical protein
MVETGAGIDALMVVLGTSGFTTTCPYGFEFVGVGFGLVMINRCIAICNITIFFKKHLKS